MGSGRKVLDVSVNGKSCMCETTRAAITVVRVSRPDFEFEYFQRIASYRTALNVPCMCAGAAQPVGFFSVLRRRSGAWVKEEMKITNKFDILIAYVARARL